MLLWVESLRVVRLSLSAGARAQYSYTFKPLLDVLLFTRSLTSLRLSNLPRVDVLLFTRSLSKTMGYKVPPRPHVTHPARDGALH